MAKQKRIVSYSDLSSDIRAKIRLTYPNGYTSALTKIPKGESHFYALVFDTDDTTYLVKVNSHGIPELDNIEDLDLSPSDEDI